MSDVEWDAEDFVPPQTRVVSDKWDGEDEELEIKASWEDDDEDKEKKDNETGLSDGLATKKKKKKIGDIIAEKEKRKIDEMERRHKEKELEKKKQTPDEILAEKLRIQKIQEDSDLQIATDLLGISKEKELTPLDEYDLSSSESLDAFRQALLKKIKSEDRLEKRPYYVTFLEDLCRDLCETLDSDDIKRVTSVLNALYNEKVKASKPAKGKKKAQSKAKLNPGQGAIADDLGDNTYAYDDYDDFI